MPIAPAGVSPTLSTATTTPTTPTTSAQPQPPPSQQPATQQPPNQASTFNNASTQGPVAGVNGNVPSAPPAPLTGQPFNGDGTIYDATAYLADRLKLSPGGEMRLFHHAYQQWPGSKPGERAWMSTKHSGGVYGKGFYTSTKPETGYGSNEFQVAIPVNAFAGKKLLEVNGYFGDKPMPDGVDILAVNNPYNTGGVWFVFKAGSDEWLNRSATTADWDAPGEVVGWS